MRGSIGSMIAGAVWRSWYCSSLLLSALLLPSCGSPGLLPRPTPGPTAEATKRISAKSAPATFVAEDGSTCRVAPEVFAHTAPGALWRCRWEAARGGERH